MPFKPNEVLVDPKAIPGDDLTKIKTLAGDVASALGVAFKKAYSHTRPLVMTFKKAEALKESKKLKGKTGLKWSVKVDGKVKEILFVISEGSKVLDEAVIFDKFKEVIDDMEVISLESDDATVKRSAERMANAKSKLTPAHANNPNARASDKVAEVSADLAAINKRKKIVLVGHGGGADVKGDVTYTANKFGGRNADQIVDFLIGEGLAKSYVGTVYLCGCYTAAGFNDPDSFAQKVQVTFAVKGYKKLSIAGTVGLTEVRDDGSIGSDPAVLDENIKKTTADTKKSLKKLEDSLKEGLADLKDAEAVLKGYEDQYASVRDLILDMPPEARGTLEDKLLTPVKKNRDDLVPAILEMRKANATLAGAVKTEQDYVKLLEKLLVNKDAYDKKKKTFGKYCEVLDDLTNVDDWWGHFGPAKATTAKVSAKKSGFDKLILAFTSKKKAKA